MDAAAAAAAGGGEAVHGDTVVPTRRGGEEKPMKVARATTGMVGGTGESSYTRNSLTQSQSLDILKPILEREIMELNFFKDDGDRSGSSAIRIADFGCGVGANTLGYAEICYRAVCRARSQSSARTKAQADELQYFFCDLPSNDFNTLFLQLEDWRKTQVPSVEDFYVTAVPGSFYGRLFPRGSLHVAISTFGVNWMSQVPDAVLDKTSPAYNKGRVTLDNDKNVALLQAIRQAARQDLHNFLLSRADEVVPSGLVLIYTTLHVGEHHQHTQWAQEGGILKAHHKIFEDTWEELVIEGVIEEDQRDTFNLPVYSHNMDDMKVIIESTNAFHIKQCEIKKQSFIPPNKAEQILANPQAYGKFITNFMKSVFNSFMVEHIGEEKCHEFFKRMERNAIIAAQEKRVSNFLMDCMLVVLVRK